MSDFQIDRLTGPLRVSATAAGLWRPRVFAARAHLVQQGEPTASVYVQVSGLTRLGYETPDGDVWVKSFITDRGFFGAAEGAGEAQPAQFSAQCLESSTIAELPIGFVIRAIEANHELRSAYAEFSDWVRRRKQAREADLLCLTAEDRYVKFLRDEPLLAARLPQGDIARYLGVTPVAFSRIKKRLTQP